jgi:hypothetical protein
VGKVVWVVLAVVTVLVTSFALVDFAAGFGASSKSGEVAWIAAAGLSAGLVGSYRHVFGPRDPGE